MIQLHRRQKTVSDVRPRGRVRRWLRRGTRGQSLAEMSLILPILFLIIFGIIDISRMIQSYVTIQHSAREGVRYGVTGRTDCDIASPTRYDCIIAITERQADNLANTPTNLEVSVRSWEFEAGGYAASPTDDDAGIQCDNLEVSVEYDYVAMFPLIGSIIGTVPLTASERLVNEPFGPCGVEDPP